MSATGLLSTRPAESRGIDRACRLARTPDELAWHFAIRHAVFVGEQKLFDGDDSDERDDHPATLHAVGGSDGLIGGTVRLYPIEGARLWKGDRLAVLPAFRHGLVGAQLVRFAVDTAGRLGGDRMVAMIQLPNVHFFESLGWSADGPAGPYHGVEHQPMTIGLNRRAP